MPIPSAPTLMLAIGGVMLVVSWWIRASRWFELVWLAGVGVTVGLMALEDKAIRGVWVTDPLSVAGQSLGLAIVTLFGIGSFGIRSVVDRTGQRFGFLSFQMAGLMLVASANDAVTMVLSLEVVQFASMALRKIDPLEAVGFPEDRSMMHSFPFHDNALVWTGAIGSLCLWVGICLVSHMCASTSFDQIRSVLADAYHPGLNRPVIGVGSKLGLLGIGLMIAGLGTRMGLVPWHVVLNHCSQGVNYWTAGCVTLVGQLASILALSRLCGTVWIGFRDELIVLFMVLAGLTFLVAASIAVLGLVPGEGRIERWLTSLPMLHGAWFAVGLASAVADLAASEQSLAAAPGQPSALAVLMFAAGGALIGLTGVFLVFSYLSRENRKIEFVDELHGVGQLAPSSSVVLVILAASLMGQPPFWGFWSYWLLCVAGFNVRSTVHQTGVTPHLGMLSLLIVGVIATLMTAGIVVRLARVAFLQPPVSQVLHRGRRASLVSAGLCALAMIVNGVAPARLLSVLTFVRGPGTISPPGPPSGTNRGQPTASRD